MPDIWVVSPTTVTKNGLAVTGYIAHEASIRTNTESHPFTEVSLVVRVVDPQSEGAREHQIVPLTAAEQAMVMAEFAHYPTYSEWRSKPGDTVTFAGTFTSGSGPQPGNIAGTDPL